jgi:antitoxin FitA
MKPAQHVRVGDALAALGRELDLTDEDLAAIDQMRDRSPAEPMTFDTVRATPARSPRR